MSTTVDFRVGDSVTVRATLAIGGSFGLANTRLRGEIISCDYYAVLVQFSAPLPGTNGADRLWLPRNSPDLELADS